MSQTRHQSQFRVIVVDDSVIDREIVVGVLTRQPGVEVVAVARDGVEALDKLGFVRADAFVIDLSMPNMGGVELLRRLRALESAPSVLVVSASESEEDAQRMISNGAAAFIRKPGTTSQITPRTFRRELESSLAQLMGAAASKSAHAAQAPSAPVGASPSVEQRGDSTELGGLPRGKVELVVIGASTGGTDALQRFFSTLPASYRVPTLVVQHLPPIFTEQFANRINKVTHLDVREARGGELLEEGRVYIAPGGKHLLVARQARTQAAMVAVDDGPPENSCRPAVDPLFRTAAQCFGSGVVGVVLTGMGGDGQLGCSAIQAAGGWVMVQDQATSVVWGMPGSVVRHGAANRVLPLDSMAPELARVVSGGR